MSTPKTEPAQPALADVSANEDKTNDIQSSSGDVHHHDQQTANIPDDPELPTSTKWSSLPIDEDLHGPIAQTTAPQPGEDEEEVPYPEPEEEDDIPHPRDFRPFFTLIEDSSGQHHHPAVHYLFADDDPDILTSAAFDTLRTSDETPQQDESEAERFVILDLSASGKEVVSASSLSSEWQALQTRVTPAPSWGGEAGENTDRGLMLRISGQETSTTSVPKEKRKKGDVEGLLRNFDENMGHLDGVLREEGALGIEVDTQTAQHGASAR